MTPTGIDRQALSGNDSAARRWTSALMANYGTPPLALARGAGAEVWDIDGRRYLDLLGGIAVNALGHAHPAVVRAVTEQISTDADKNGKQQGPFVQKHWRQDWRYEDRDLHVFRGRDRWQRRRSRTAKYSSIIKG